MSTVRAFLAINFPLPAVRRIAEEIEALRPKAAEAGCRVAWVPAANIHLTLKFFGAIEELAVEAIRGRLARELPSRKPFDLEAKGLGAFPSPAHPRVLWAGVTPTPELAALQQDVEAWMADLGFSREERAFHPHLTIGRVKDPGRTPAAEWLPTLLDARASLIFGAGAASEVVIYESRTLQQGAEYRALARVAIGK